MKAIRIHVTGGPEVMSLEEVETPISGAGEVLIKVVAAGVNFGETMQRAGTYPLPLRLPRIMGSEVAGTVAQLGTGVTHPVVGTRVVASMLATQTGGYAEYAVVNADELILLPDEVDFAQATALLSQGLTAYFLLQQAALPRGSETVLVNAAAGGVGSLAMQLAKLMGAKSVIGTASSTSKLELIKSLGADVAINYMEADWVKQVKAATSGRGADIILDANGGEVSQQSFQALAPFGRFVAYGALSSQVAQFTGEQISQLIFQNQSIIGFALPNILAQPGRAQTAFTELLKYVTSGRLKVVVKDRFALAEAAAAHRAIEERQTTGKVVLIV